MALRDRVIEVLKKWCGTDAVIGATRSWKTSGTEPRLDFRPRFSNFVEMICFAEQEVKLFLKARSRIIQMTDSRDGILKMTEYRVIYEYPKDNPPASAA